MTNVRATITLYRTSYTLGGGDGRVRPVEIAILRRQTQRGAYDGWRTTRSTRIDAGSNTLATAHRHALAFSPDVTEYTVELPSLGVFNLAVDAERDAMLAAVRAIGEDTVSRSLPRYDAQDASGAAAFVGCG